jgi:hypothetical protein
MGLFFYSDSIKIQASGLIVLRISCFAFSASAKISKGLTTNDIAAKLFVSSRTIETHRANILKKLEVKNTAELIKKAAEINLI